jgi:hypothetical protein
MTNFVVNNPLLTISAHDFRDGLPDRLGVVAQEIGTNPSLRPACDSADHGRPAPAEDLLELRRAGHRLDPRADGASPPPVLPRLRQGAP